MSEPLVSVVTPFHNTAPFLAQCIESVLRQRYENWEYVLVDNASTDGSSEIARYYARQEARLRVVRYEELVAQVPNYNRALGQIGSHSKYVKMVEADNWLFPECLQQMVALAEAHPRVGIVSAYNMTETRIRLTGLPLARSVIDGGELARMHLAGDAYLFGAPTTVLMRADLVRAVTPFYDEGHWIGEDASAVLNALRSSDFGFVHQILTFVRTENESTLSKIKNFDPQALDEVVLLRRHGADFLSSAELAAAQQRTSRRYYAVLAEAMVRRPGEAYWQFHRRGLASVGLELERSALMRALARVLLARALNPGTQLQHWMRAVWPASGRMLERPDRRSNGSRCSNPGPR